MSENSPSYRSQPKSMAPTEVPNAPPVGGTVLQHPAFGCVVVNRVSVSGGGARLFGSDLGHHSLVRIEVHEAQAVRNLSYDRHEQTRLVCSFEMSEAQWVSMIASQGMGAGVPVTFNHRREGDLVACPQIAAPSISKQELHGKEMEASLRKALADMQDVASRIEAMVSKPGSISKTELAELSKLLSRRVEQAPGSVEYIFKQFGHATESVASAAKTEVEAFIANTAQRIGLKQMQLPSPDVPAPKQLDADAQPGTAE